MQSSHTLENFHPRTCTYLRNYNLRRFPSIETCLNDILQNSYRIQLLTIYHNDKIPSPIWSINFSPLTHRGRKNYTRVDEKTFAKRNDYPTSDWPIKSNRAITLRAYRNRIRLNTTRECHSRDNKMDTSHVTSLGERFWRDAGTRSSPPDSFSLGQRS